jgi:threonine aldolase
MARRFAEGLNAIDGVAVVNDVVLNQVLVRVGDEATTDRIALAIQESGDAWLGTTTWHGERLLRISVSNWSTTSQDIDRSIGAVANAVRRIGRP